MLREKDKNFLFGWFGSLIVVWYISVGLYIHNPDLLHMLYWPLHTHDVEIGENK